MYASSDLFFCQGREPSLDEVDPGGGSRRGCGVRSGLDAWAAGLAVPKRLRPPPFFLPRMKAAMLPASICRWTAESPRSERPRLLGARTQYVLGFDMCESTRKWTYYLVRRSLAFLSIYIACGCGIGIAKKRATRAKNVRAARKSACSGFGGEYADRNSIRRACHLDRAEGAGRGEISVCALFAPVSDASL